jgi:hypothetical protein
MWVQSADVSPLVVMIVQDEHGRPVELTGYLETFLPFARKLLALNQNMTQAAQNDASLYDTEAV